MNFTEIQKKYPMHNTIIGFFNTDESFKANTYEEIQDVEKYYAPLDGFYDTGLPFIIYEDDRFYCHAFLYDRVKGYYTDGEKYYLVTFSEDLGTEITDPNDTDEYHQVIVWNDNISKEELTRKLAKEFDEKAYSENRVFINFNELEKFIIARENK